MLWFIILTPIAFSILTVPKGTNLCSVGGSNSTFTFIDNGNGTFTIQYDDGTSFTTSNLTGPQGPAGISGVDGAVGPIGPNEGSFDQNLGLAGFYSDDKQLTVSGAFVPVFHDFEISVENGLQLETSLHVTNNSNLITGDIRTPRSAAAIYTNFMDNSFYTGESSVPKINGYAAIRNKESFIFPVGVENRLRPLAVTTMA